jgi:hypothetical protein
MDELTNQAIDMIFDNDALNKRIVNPLKKKAFPYLMTVIFFNIVLFVLVCHLVRKLSKINTMLFMV